MTGLQEKAKETIRASQMIGPRDRVLAAVSGGPDSVALLDFLYNYLGKDISRLSVIHIDHCLRKDSGKDAELVKKLCKKLGIRCLIKKIDVAKYSRTEKLSLEEAGRACRYRAFDAAAKESGSDKIALAHTADDKVETFIMRLIRGTGLKGLVSIPAKRGAIIRPFIGVWKSEILDHLKLRKLPYAVDSSNLENKFFRNNVRNRLLPLLEEFNPKVKSAILSAVTSAGDDYSMISRVTEQLFRKLARTLPAGGISIEQKRFRRLSYPEKANLIRLAVERIKSFAPDIEKKHIELIINMKTGAVCLPGGLYVVIGKDRIKISKTNKGKKTAKSFKYLLDIPGEVLIGEISKKIECRKMKKRGQFLDSVAYVDAAAVKSRKFTVRSPRPGDRFVPLGMKKKKKLSDFFVDNKVERSERSGTAVVCDGKDIIWVAGHRIADAVKLGADTREIICLTLIDI